MPLRYEVGLDLALADGSIKEIPGWSREVILSVVIAQVALVDGYELRALFPWDADVDCPHDVTEGEMLYLVGEAIGGPLAAAEADAVITEADTIGRRGELDEALSPLLVGPLLGAKRMLILPPHCFTQLSRQKEGQPLHGVAFVPAAEIKKLLSDMKDVEPFAHLARLVDFCMRTRVVLSATTLA